MQEEKNTVRTLEKTALLCSFVWVASFGINQGVHHFSRHAHFCSIEESISTARLDT